MINMQSVRTVPKMPYNLAKMRSAISERFGTAVDEHWMDGHDKSMKDNVAQGFLSIIDRVTSSPITPFGGASALVFRICPSYLFPMVTHRRRVFAGLATALRMSCNPHQEDDSLYIPSVTVVPNQLASVFERYPFLQVHPLWLPQ